MKIMKHISYRIHFSYLSQWFSWFLKYRWKYRRYKLISPQKIENLKTSSGELRLNIGLCSQHFQEYLNCEMSHINALDIAVTTHDRYFPDSSIDEIHCSKSIEDFDRDELALALLELHRILKNDGLLKVQFSNVEQGQAQGADRFKKNIFSRVELTKLLSDYGFKSLTCEASLTQPENADTIMRDSAEYLIYEGVKTNSHLKIFHADPFSEFTGLSNSNGLKRAFSKVGLLKTFDYRGLAKTYGSFVMNKLFIQAAVKFKPHIIYLGKSESIYGSSILKIKQLINTRVIHFYGDLRYEPQPWVVSIGKQADLTLLYHKDYKITQKHIESGIKNVGHWWIGTDPDIFYPRIVKNKYDVVFMANNTRDYQETTGQDYRKRLALVEAIAKNGIDLHLFGLGWEHLAGTPNIHLHSFINDNEFSEACSSAKISLGLNSNDVKMYTSWRRPFNSMASGTFHIMNYFSGLETVFENKKDLVWFTTIHEAIELLKYYLIHDKEREEIARTGRLNVITNHTWDIRVSDLIEKYQTMDEL
jgi:hypothetical protein